MGWDAMYISGMHLDCTTFGTKVSILTSHRQGVWKFYIIGRWEIRCMCITSYFVVLMVDNIVNERITLRSWDFTEYHLRMIWFWYEELTVGRIILHSWDLSGYHVWTTDLSGFLMLNQHYDGQRAPTDTAVVLVMSCSWELWCFCRETEPYLTFSKTFNHLRTEWTLLILSGSLLGISSRLESSLPFAQKPLLGFCDLWAVFELNT
jgi:hypothetical protein